MDDKNLLNSKDVVGDISLRFFNNKGQFIATEIDDRIVGLSIDQIQKIPRVIGVAGGESKFPVIKAVLEGKLVDVLITDKHTAEKLAINNA